MQVYLNPKKCRMLAYLPRMRCYGSRSIIRMLVQKKPRGLYQKELGPNWMRDAPATVKATGVYCDLAPRRLLWAPDATINSREYNWSIIEGSFDTPFECTTAYTLFFETHKTHRDPVYFCVAIYARFLAMVCMTHRICINVNQYESRTLSSSST